MGLEHQFFYAVFLFKAFFFYNFTIFCCFPTKDMKTPPPPSIRSGHLYIKHAQCVETKEKSYLRFLRFLIFELLAPKRLQKMRKKNFFTIFLKPWSVLEHLHRVGQFFLQTILRILNDHISKTKKSEVWFFIRFRTSHNVWVCMLLTRTDPIFLIDFRWF